MQLSLKFDGGQILYKAKNWGVVGPPPPFCFYKLTIQYLLSAFIIRCITIGCIDIGFFSFSVLPEVTVISFILIKKGLAYCLSKKYVNITHTRVFSRSHMFEISIPLERQNVTLEYFLKKSWIPLEMLMRLHLFGGLGSIPRSRCESSMPRPVLSSCLVLPVGLCLSSSRLGSRNLSIFGFSPSSKLSYMPPRFRIWSFRIFCAFLLF